MTTGNLDDLHYTIRHEVAAKAVSDDETVILDLRSEEYYALNSTGSRIWAELESGGSLDRLAADLAAETGEDRAVIHADAIELLDHLTAVGLIQATARER